MKIVSEYREGSINNAIEWVNKYNLAQELVQFFPGGFENVHTIVVLQVPDDFDLKSHMANI